MDEHYQAVVNDLALKLAQKEVELSDARAHLNRLQAAQQEAVEPEGV